MAVAGVEFPQFLRIPQAPMSYTVHLTTDKTEATRLLAARPDLGGLCHRRPGAGALCLVFLVRGRGHRWQAGRAGVVVSPAGPAHPAHRGRDGGGRGDLRADGAARACLHQRAGGPSAAAAGALRLLGRPGAADAAHGGDGGDVPAGGGRARRARRADESRRAGRPRPYDAPAGQRRRAGHRGVDRLGWAVCAGRLHARPGG